MALLSDVGCVRSNNEDTGVVVRPGGANRLDPPGVLAVVADGMGGHAAGDVASQLAVEWIPKIYFGAEEAGVQALVESIEVANAEIFERARSERDGMGTTVVALALVGDAAWIAHVGDSRIYRVREGRIEALTRDHSLVRQLVDEGHLSEAEAETHPDRNVVLRALGTQPDVDVEAPTRPLRLAPDDHFVLCSDGLTDLVSGDEILECVDAAPAYEACQQLVELARQRGGHDNITVAILRVREPGDARRSPPPDTRGATP